MPEPNRISSNERIELGSDMVYEALVPLTNHITGRVQPKYEKAAAYALAVCQVTMEHFGYTEEEIQHSLGFGVETINDYHHALRKMEGSSE